MARRRQERMKEGGSFSGLRRKARSSDDHGGCCSTAAGAARGRNLMRSIGRGPAARQRPASSDRHSAPQLPGWTSQEPSGLLAIVSAPVSSHLLLHFLGALSQSGPCVVP